MYTEEQLKNYIRTFRFKQKFMNTKENFGLFIITYSRYNNGKTYLSDLKEQLINKNYILNKRSEEEIFNTLKETSTESYINRFIYDIVIAFISIFKQNGYGLDYLDELIKSNDGDLKKQLIILKDIYIYYQSELEKNHNIDFEDMIHKAYYIMPKIREKDLGVDYKYLIIDEYQDISRQRFNLISRLSNLFDAKIMAVGDD